MSRTLPRFSVVLSHFPDKVRFPTPTLLKTIGGEVRQAMNDGDNTCAIRISHALNLSGAELTRVPGILMLKSAPHLIPTTAHHATPSTGTGLYISRVGMMREYLTNRYGAGRKIYDGHHQDRFVGPSHGVIQGIILFEWQGRPRDFGATGHVDLYRGLVEGNPQALAGGCIGQCFFMPGPMLAYV